MKNILLNSSAKMHLLKKCKWLFCMLLFMGCGNTDGLEVVLVTGRVLLDGQPMTSGSVITTPVVGRGSQGNINSDGSFTLETRGLGPGATVGTHRVSVVAYENPKAIRNSPESSSGKLAVPEHYASAGSSKLTIDVKQGGKNDFTLKLSSKSSGSRGN